MEKNQILIVDDDDDDLELIRCAADELKLDRPIHFFRNGTELQNHLKQTDVSPFLIICDVNLPGQDGFAVRKQTAEDNATKYKSVPFIFWSTSANERQIQHAYDLPAQGFFFKPNNFNDLCETLRIILQYWATSQHPKKVT
jgi:CheY-like chemotaxis protein